MNQAMAFAVVAAALLVAPGRASAHCDTMSGPVVSDARQALETGNLNLVLVWVQPKDDAAIRDEFEKARAGRQAGGEARAAAETRFFEALVRIHRAGEGAPYTGIKPADTDIGVAVPAADRALASGSAVELQKLVGDAVHTGIQKHFEEARERRRYDPNDVAAGRAYVKSYVEFTHYVERLHETATSTAHDEHAKANAGEHAAAPPEQGGHGGGGGPAGHVPWLLAGFLGLALAVETGWLVAHRRD
jgi:hypothetical protein